MLPVVEISDQLNKLGMYKTMSLNRMHERLLRELVYVIVMLLSIISER